MNEAKDNEGNLATDDKRITPVGYWLRKSSIDELPQLINVLKGEMSLIGPRPLLIEYLPLYNEKHKKRHKVLPGLTGWAQVNGRNEATWPERLDKDVYYAENVSFALDCLIFFKTFWLVLTGKGVSETGKATMTPFRGYSE